MSNRGKNFAIPKTYLQKIVNPTPVCSNVVNLQDILSMINWW